MNRDTLGIGLAVVALIPPTFSTATEQRHALIVSGALVLGVATLAKSWEVGALAGVAVAAYAYLDWRRREL